MGETEKRATARVGRPTISEVAAAAGVSRSTVSRVFSRPEHISAETIRRVRDVADRLDYRPNPTARALSTGRSRNVAVFVPDIANPFFPPLIAEVQNAAAQEDYCVFLASSGEVAERELLLAERLGAQVEGMILVSPRTGDAEIAVLARRHTLVLVNRDHEEVPRVLIDSATGTREAVAHLAALGHERLVYVSGPDASWSNAQRHAAAAESAAAAGLALTTIATARPSFEAGRRAVPALIDCHATAVLAFDDTIAQGILAGLCERGVKVPERISVIGCDDVLGAATWPALTTVSNRSEQAGLQALAMLLGRLDGAVPDVPCEMIGTRLVVRETTAPPG